MTDCEIQVEHPWLILGPGSRILDLEDMITVTWPLNSAQPQLTLEGLRLGQLWSLATAIRPARDAPSPGLVADIHVSTLLQRFEAAGGDISDPARPLRLIARSGASQARMELRRAPLPCQPEGDLDAPLTALVTGFAPFPAGSTHDNVSAVGIRALDLDALPGVRVIRAVLPVEYDHAAALITDLIDRSRPDLIINFGQGGADIALEQVAYNLKDTSKVKGGRADNRGIVATGELIEAEGPETRPSTLPLLAIAEALAGLEIPVTLSTNPGRYICNNVFYAVQARAAEAGIPAGFIHLPTVRDFDEDTRQRWGQILTQIVSAAAAAMSTSA